MFEAKDLHSQELKHVSASNLKFMISALDATCIEVSKEKENTKIVFLDKSILIHDANEDILRKYTNVSYYDIADLLSDNDYHETASVFYDLHSVRVDNDSHITNYEALKSFNRKTQLLKELNDYQEKSIDCVKYLSKELNINLNDIDSYSHLLDFMYDTMKDELKLHCEYLDDHALESECESKEEYNKQCFKNSIYYSVSSI